jgi:hypothetical protein
VIPSGQEMPQPPEQHRRLPAVAVGGLPYFGRRLAGILDGDGWRATYLETRSWEPRAALRALRQTASADIVYLVGGQIARFSRPHALKLVYRRPMVMHWAGSDVLYARRIFTAGRSIAALTKGVTHWTGAPWLVDELRPLGIRARWLPHSWVDAPSPPPLLGPAESPFTILAYLPKHRFEFYGGAVVVEIARALPDARVLVAGTDSLPCDAPANLRCLGWVDDMATVYRKVHALLRLPQHDGLSFMVQEALAAGRYAVWSYPFPGAIRVESTAEAIGAMRALVRLHADGRLSWNETGVRYVREHYSRDRIRSALRTGLLATLRRSRSGQPKG